MVESPGSITSSSHAGYYIIGFFPSFFFQQLLSDLFADHRLKTSHLGKEGIIHGSRTLVMQTDDGQIVEPYSVSAGLDYPGIGPLHAFLAEEKRAEVLAVTDEEALNAAFCLTEMEGIIPALESAHALAVLEQKTFRPEEIVVINLSGRGDKDMQTYKRMNKFLHL